MKKHILIGLIILLLPHITQAQELYFGISIDCFGGCKNKEIYYTQDIIFEVNITNNLDYWVSIGSDEQYGAADFNIIAENSNLAKGKEREDYPEFLGRKYFIKPKFVLRVYLPFSIYNNLEKDRRLGDWKITPEMVVNRGFKFYNTPFESKEIPLYVGGKSFSIPSPVKGNVLEFKVIMPEARVEQPTGKISLPEFPPERSWLGWILSIAAGVIILVAGMLLYGKAKRKTKGK